MPVAAPALADLLWIALLLFSFAFVWTARKLIAALLGSLIALLQSIPAIGKYIASPFEAAEQAVANALGSAESAIDSAIGASWHFLARLTTELWHEITAHATLLLELATGVYPIVVALRYLKSYVHSLTTSHGATAARVKTLEREYHGIEHQVKTLEQELKGIDEVGIRKRLGAIEQEVSTVEHQTIPAIQQAESDAQTAIGNLYDWVKGKASILGVGTFSVAVAAALEALGLGGLRCPSFLNSLSRRGCGLFNGLEDMLGLFVDLFIITDLCDVIPLLETAYADVAAPAVSLLTEAIDSMPCVAGHQPPALHVPALHLPAHPGLALSLP